MEEGGREVGDVQVDCVGQVYGRGWGVWGVWLGWVGRGVLMTKGKVLVELNIDMCWTKQILEGWQLGGMPIYLSLRAELHVSVQMEVL